MDGATPETQPASAPAVTDEERDVPAAPAARLEVTDRSGAPASSGETTRSSTPAVGGARELVDPFGRVASPARPRLADPFLVDEDGRGEASGFADPFARARAGHSPEHWSR